MTEEQKAKADYLILHHLLKFTQNGLFKVGIDRWMETGNASGTFRESLHDMMEEYSQSQVNDALDKAIEAAIKLSYSPWGHESFPIIASESLIEELKLLKR